MRLFGIFLFLFFALVRSKTCKEEKDVFKELFPDSKKHYVMESPKSAIKPGVEVEMMVQDVEMTTSAGGRAHMDMQVYLNLRWKDERLSFEAMKPCSHNLSLTYHHHGYLWKPELTFLATRTVSVDRSPEANEHIVVSSDGSLASSRRLHVSKACQTMFTGFPSDKVVCQLTLTTFTRHEEHIAIAWKNSSGQPLVLLRQIAVADFQFLGVKTNHIKVNYLVGTWSELTASFEFTRQIGGRIMVQVYLPLVQSLVISWFGFFLHPDKLMFRVNLGLLPFATLLFVYLNLHTVIPSNFLNFWNKIHSWIFVCCLFAVAYLLETILSHYMLKSNRIPGNGEAITIHWKWSRIDWISIIVFPLTFLFFVSIYALV